MILSSLIDIKFDIFESNNNGEGIWAAELDWEEFEGEAIKVGSDGFDTMWDFGGESVSLYNWARRKEIDKKGNWKMWLMPHRERKTKF